MTEVKRAGEKEGDGVTAELRARHRGKLWLILSSALGLLEGPVVSNGWGQDWMRKILGGWDSNNPGNR